MKILLVDVDSSIPNLAIMKLAGHYKGKGHNVDFIKLKYDGKPGSRQKSLIKNSEYDKVFVSIIFTVNKEAIVFDKPKLNNYEIGGTGYDLTVKLPPEVDAHEEDWSLYPANKFYYNFLSRGCNRQCDFCFVWRKEGTIHKYKSLDYILEQMKKWGFNKVKFMDNNIFFLPECDGILQELVDNKVSCQFNQGLDFRLLTDKRSELLSKMRLFGEHIFAFDDINLKDIMDKKIKIYKKFNPRKWRAKFFIYCNANEPIQDVVYRIKWCKDNEVPIEKVF
jgi:hypothetical protein